MFAPTHISSSAPTVNDDFSAGFRPGIHWYNTSTGTFYVMIDDAEGAADWNTVSSGDVGSWSDWSPSYTWTGNTPTGITTVARYITVGDICIFTLDVNATTAAGSSLTDVAFTLPETVTDNNNYIPVGSSYTDGGSSANDNVAVVDGNTPAGVIHQVFNAIAQSTAFDLYFAGFYEYTPSP